QDTVASLPGPAALPPAAVPPAAPPPAAAAIPAPALGEPRTVKLDFSTTAFAFTPGDQKIMSASGSTGLKLNQAESGAAIRHLDGEAKEGFGAAVLSPDTRRLAAGVAGKPRVWLWDTATGRPIRTLDILGLDGPIAFTRDGRWLVTGGSNGGQIQIWDVDSGTA